MVAFLFAGQGSQYIGMGKDLYESFPESKAVFDKANEELGFSLSGLCFDGPQEELKRTNNSQVAIFTVSIAALEAYRPNLLGPPSYAAGLSLGEYSALVAAEAIGFEDALRLLRKRGEFMEEAALEKPSGMLSLIGLSIDEVKEICSQTNTEIANINCPGQIVISGSSLKIAEAQSLAKERNAKLTVPLEVSGAFHSSFMKGASLKLAREIEKVSIKAPKIAVISNVTAKPYVNASEIKDNLVRQVASPVLWEDSMRFILSQGVRNFIEFGPGKVLKGLMRRIDPAAEVVSIEKKEDIENAA
jgi:[acyl-carrier-protein] S-malonyltransferase